MAANRAIHTLLKEGVQVNVPDPERGGQKSERVRVIDWMIRRRTIFWL